MPPQPFSLTAGLLTALTLALSACGSDAERDGDDGSKTPPQPTASTSAGFPPARGKTIADLREGLAGGPVLVQAVSVLEPGDNRFGFGLFDRTHKQIAGARVAIYVAREGEGTKAQGPFRARSESLAVKGPFRSRSVALDPDAARSIFTATLPVALAGDYELLALARIGGKLLAADRIGVRVARKSPVPAVGERAPRISTPTRQSVDGQIGAIETRVPPDSMHETDFADALGKRPIVLVFATPALCQSRVCAPVVDIAEQVKSAHNGEAAFIHMEIYKDNEVEKGFRPQVRAWRLPTEPWAFTIDLAGKVAARIEGPFSERELERAVDAAMR